MSVTPNSSHKSAPVVYFFDGATSPDDDYQKFRQGILKSLKKINAQPKFNAEGDAWTFFKVNLRNAYDEASFIVKKLEDPNTIKCASVIVYVIAHHLPIQKAVATSTDKDTRLANLYVAYRIAMWYVKNAKQKKNAIAFPMGAEFPSIHSFVDFIYGLMHFSGLCLEHSYLKSSPCATVGTAECDTKHSHYPHKYLRTAVAMVTKIALILELCLYRMNPKPIGLSDDSALDEIAQNQYGNPDLWNSLIEEYQRGALDNLGKKTGKKVALMS